MARITKEQEKRRDELAALLRKQADTLGDAIEEYNAATQKAWQELERHVESYNKLIADANEFRDEVSTELQSIFDEKPDRWQESERGEAYAAWMAEWETDLGCVEFDEPAEIQAPEIDDAGDAVESWPADDQ